MGFPYQRQEDVPADHTFVVEVSPAQREELLSVMRKQPANAANRAIIEALELAELLDLPPVRRSDFWGRREKWAMAGYSIIDQAFDGFAAAKEPPASCDEGKGAE